MPPKKRKLDVKIEQNEQGQYECHLCGLLFFRGCGLSSHLRRHAPVTYDCTHCQYKSKHKYSLERHIASAHADIIESGPLLPNDGEGTSGSEAKQERKVEAEESTGEPLRRTARAHKPKRDIEETGEPPAKKRLIVNNPRISKPVPAQSKKESYKCPFCEVEFTTHQRIAFHIIHHRQTLHFAPEGTKYFSKKLGVNRGGFKKKSREFRRWRMRKRVPNYLKRRDELVWHMEQNFGHSIQKTIPANSKSQESKSNEKTRIDYKIENVRKTVFRKNLQMRSGRTFGQRVTFEGEHYYFCLECPYTTWSASSLWRHFLNHVHATKQCWTCISCSFSSGNRVKVDSHVKLHKNITETELEFSNWLRYERRVNKTDLDRPGVRRIQQPESPFTREWNTRSSTFVFEKMAVEPKKPDDKKEAQPEDLLAQSSSEATSDPVPEPASVPRVQLRNPRRIPDAENTSTGLTANRAVQGTRGGTRQDSSRKSTIPQSSSSSANAESEFKTSRRAGPLPENNPLPKANEAPAKVKMTISDEPSTSESSQSPNDIPSTSSQQDSNVFAAPEPVPTEPQFEDFMFMKDETTGIVEERHYVEAWRLYRRAMIEFREKEEKPVYPIADINYPKVMHPSALAQVGRNNPLEYLRNEAKIEASRECADCPYKCSDLEKFRRHRDRHFNGGINKCKECNYASNNPHQVREHMFVDHYLNDVKLIEGLPSSDSEDDTPPPTPPPKIRKGRKTRLLW